MLVIKKLFLVLCGLLIGFVDGLCLSIVAAVAAVIAIVFTPFKMAVDTAQEMVNEYEAKNGEA